MLTKTSLVDVLQSWADRAPGQIALTYLEDGELPGRDFTYEQLDCRSREIAAGLQRFLDRGDRVLLLHPPGLEFVAAFFACLYAGIIPAPAFPPRNRRHYPRIEALLENAGARCILTEKGAEDRLSTWLAERGKQIEVISTDEFQGGSDTFRPVPVGPDDLAFLQYTSGSTGQPKGVMVSHGNLMATQRMIQRAMGHREGLIEVSWLPIYHDMGLIGNLMQPLFLGGRCIFMSPVAFLQQPRRWLAAISHFQAQGTGGPNFSFKLCTRNVVGEQKAGLDLSSVKVFYSGSESIASRDLYEFVEAFQGNGLTYESLYTCYGLAEATLMVTGSKPGCGPVMESVVPHALEQNIALPASSATTAEGRLLVGCGQSVEGGEVAIVDPEGKRRRDGDVGEVWIRGPHVAKGYWREEELSRQTFGAELEGSGPFLKTGDLGYLRDGQLFITGRIKDLIIVNGKNFYPQDVERTVQEATDLFAIGGVAAFSIPENGEETLIVAGEVQRSVVRNLPEEEVYRTIAREVLAEHGLKVRCIVLLRPAGLPRTSSGKVQRRACRQQIQNGHLDELTRWENKAVSIVRLPANPSLSNFKVWDTPRSASDFENWFQAWLSGRLNCSPAEIDRDRAFADFGLDSVASVSLSSQLSEWTGFEIAPTLVWDYPTVRLAAEYLAAEQTLFALRASTTTFESESRVMAKAGNTFSPQPVLLKSQVSMENHAELLARELASLREERPI